MKRFSKICLIIAAAIMALGLVSLISGIAMGGTLKDVSQAFRRGDYTFGDNYWLDEDGVRHYDNYEEASEAAEAAEYAEAAMQEANEAAERAVLNADEESKRAVEQAEEEAREAIKQADDAARRAVESEEGNKFYIDGDSEVMEFSNISKLDVEMRSGRLILIKSEDKKLRVETIDYKGRRSSVEQEENEVKIYNNFRNNRGDVIVHLPSKDTLSEIDIEIGGGLAVFETPVKAVSMEVHIGAGKFEGTELIQAVESDWEVGAGEIILNELSGDQLDFQCGAGQITAYIKGSQNDYNYDLECGIGEVRVGDKVLAGIARENVKNNPGSNKNIEAQCSVGSVYIEFEQ